MDVVVSEATPQDLPALAELLSHATAYKVSQGDGAWGSDPFTVSELEDYMQHMSLYVARVSGNIAGTFSIDWQTDELWGDSSTEAAYLHRLAVAEPNHSRGLGAELIASAELMLAKHGKTTMRFDCEDANVALCSYYEQRGFERVGTKTSKNLQASGKPYVAALFEKSVHN